MRRGRRRLVFWLHETLSGTSWVERCAALTRPDMAVANSHCSAAALPALFPGVPREVLYCAVVPPTSHPVEDRARVRAELATPNEATVILQACRLEPLKGHEVLLEALGRLRDRPGWVAWIAGGVQRPRERAYLEGLLTQAEALGISDRVRFLGHRSDVSRLLAAADIHCQPNTGPESFGIAFIEALYARLPVVSTWIGGAVEIVTESCGVLVPPIDPAPLAEALVALIDQPEARRRLGAAGPERARSLCDPAATLARIEDLLRGVSIGAMYVRGTA